MHLIQKSFLNKIGCILCVRLSQAYLNLNGNTNCFFHYFFIHRMLKNVTLHKNAIFLYMFYTFNLKYDKFNLSIEPQVIFYSICFYEIYYVLFLRVQSVIPCDDIT